MPKSNELAHGYGAVVRRRDGRHMFRMSPNTEREYRRALEQEGLLDRPALEGGTFRNPPAARRTKSSGARST